jgi:hypothetical protein
MDVSDAEETRAQVRRRARLGARGGDAMPPGMAECGGAR